MTLLELQTSIFDKKNPDFLTSTFDLLWGHLRPLSSAAQEMYLLHESWKDSEREYGRGIITYELKAMNSNRIRASLLKVVEGLRESDLQEAPNPDMIAIRLMVLTPTEETENEIRKFFPFEYFREPKFFPGGTYPTEILPDDLVVFDSFNHPKAPVDELIRKKQIETLQDILDYTDCFIVWFGSFGEMVTQNSDRIYAANFRFALYPRIREMLDFLKYYRGKV